MPYKDKDKDRESEARYRDNSTLHAGERICSRCRTDKARRSHRWCLSCCRAYDGERLTDPLKRRRKRERDNAWQHKKRREDPAFSARHVEANKKWRRTLSGAMSHRVSAKRRRARRAGLVNTLTTAEWVAILAAAKGRCYYCKQKRPLTMDHVIPISSGGAHAAYNIVAACRSCNASKGARRTMLL